MSLTALKVARRRERDWEGYQVLYGHEDRLRVFWHIQHDLTNEEY